MPLSPRVPELGALEMLLSVARLGSFGRAADEHGVTQQAVSSRIGRTERLLGLTLVQRGPRGSALTPTGVVVAQWAAEVLSAAQSLEHGIDALRSEQRDRLRVAASMTVAEYLAPRWLTTARYEGLTVSLATANSAEVARQVRDGDVDVGFVEGPFCPHDVEATTVHRDRLEVVVHREHAWARAGRVSAAELAATPLVHREPGSGTRSTLLRALRHLDPAEPALELSSASAVRAAAEDAVAPAVISALALQDALRTGRLVRVQVADVDLSRSLRAIWPAGEALVGARRRFVALARRSARLTPG